MPPGEVGQCLETFGVVTMGRVRWRRYASSMWQVEARDDGKQPTVFRPVHLTTKNLSLRTSRVP